MILIAKGHLDDRAPKYLLGSWATAPLKPDGRERPICVAEVFYRVTATHIIRGNRTEIGEVLGPIQYGCAISNGLSFASTLAQERLLDADLKHAGCKLDIKSFFNNLDRNTMLSELY